MDTDDLSGDEHGQTFADLLQDQNFMSATVKRQILRQMVKALPGPVQRRVKALKNLQLDYLNLEAKFYEEVYQIEKKYIELYQPIMEKRKKIIAGEVEPTDEEANYQSNTEEEDDEMSERLKEVTLEMKKDMEKYPQNLSGIPDFWLTVFKTTEVIADMVQPHDQPILKELRDIKIVHDTDGMAYTLEFHFAPNEYFKDTVLTKKYFMRSELDKEEPFNFEGPEIYKCTGCVINWLPGKNVTVKTIKKKQKHKARGAVRTITKQIPNDSFFNFFNPPILSDDAKPEDESQAILASDFEIGHFLRVRIIPKAVLFFTGDYVDDEDDDDEEEEEEEVSEDELSDSDNDEGSVPAIKQGGGKKSGGGGGGSAAQNAQPAECKQQ